LVISRNLEKWHGEQRRRNPRPTHKTSTGKGNGSRLCRNKPTSKPRTSGATVLSFASHPNRNSGPPEKMEHSKRDHLRKWNTRNLTHSTTLGPQSDQNLLRRDDGNWKENGPKGVVVYGDNQTNLPILLDRIASNEEKHSQTFEKTEL